MKVLSLFDGMSCGMLAFERANIDVSEYFASEVDDFAIKISKKNHKKIIQVGDVRSLDPVRFVGIDFLIGGSPCQSFSNAGGNATGFEGKSNLFFEFQRIFEAVKPKYFLFENVVMIKEWRDVITNALGVEPVKIDSGLFSAQRRERLYWTNIRFPEPRDNGLLFRDIIDRNTKHYALSPLLMNRFKILHPDDGSRLVIGSTSGKNEINQKARVYGVNGKIPTLLSTDYKQPKQVYVDGLLRKCSPLEYERLQTLPDNYTYGVSDTQRYKMIGNGWTVDVIAYILKHANK